MKGKAEQVSVERKSLVGVDKTVENAKKSLPKFSESVDFHSYLTLFERTMENFQIDRSKWPSIFQSHVTGKVIKVFVELPVE